MNHRHVFPLALALCFLVSCSSPTAPNDPGTTGVTNDGTYVSGTGTVTYFPIEGGFYAIKGDDNKTYDPINLDKGFQFGGVRVRFHARLRNDLLGYHGVGSIVELLEIKIL